MLRVLISTYNRPKQLEKLLSDLKHPNLKVTIFDDGSQFPAREAKKMQHHGKKRYYQLVTSMFQFLKDKDFEYFFMLPDDVRLHPDFFELSLAHWDAIQDPYKICLSVGHTHNRHYEPCWTRFQPIKMGDIVQTQWNDLCFMADRRFLEALNYQIEQPKPGYNYASSGVGRYISKTLDKKGFHLYHTDKSLVEFPANESRMHVNQIA